MGALAVIEGFDVVEDLLPSLAVAEEHAPVDHLQFERAPEAFHRGVVVAVAFAAHGGGEAGLGQSSPVIPGGVLDAAIRVKEQIGWWLAVQEGHGKSI